MYLNQLIKGLEFQTQLTLEVEKMQRKLDLNGGVDLTALVLVGLIASNLSNNQSWRRIDALITELGIIKGNIRNGPPTS